MRQRDGLASCRLSVAPVCCRSAAFCAHAGDVQFRGRPHVSASVVFARSSGISWRLGWSSSELECTHEFVDVVHRCFAVCHAGAQDILPLEHCRRDPSLPRTDDPADD